MQRDKFIKLLGVRYNPDTDSAKMSCDSFNTQAKNRQFLVDRVADLLKETKEGKDTFEDVPFDFRHHKPKTFHHFPKEWIMTEERKLELGAAHVKRIEKQWKVQQKLTALKREKEALLVGAELQDGNRARSLFPIDD